MYTFIFEYRKGTYISQIMAETISIAISNWASTIDGSIIPNFTSVDRDALINELKKEENTPVAIKKMSNVWCVFFKIRRSYSLLNIVLTRE